MAIMLLHYASYQFDSYQQDHRYGSIFTQYGYAMNIISITIMIIIRNISILIMIMTTTIMVMMIILWDHGA